MKKLLLITALFFITGCDSGPPTPTTKDVQSHVDAQDVRAIFLSPIMRKISSDNFDDAPFQQWLNTHPGIIISVPLMGGAADGLVGVILFVPCPAAKKYNTEVCD